MVTTRSMSRIAAEGEGASKQTRERESIVKRARIAAEGASKQTRERESFVTIAKPKTIFDIIRERGESVTWSDWTIEDSALCLFMVDYVKRYYENHPLPIVGALPYEVDRAGQLEWRNMSAMEQDPWIKKAKEDERALDDYDSLDDSDFTDPNEDSGAEDEDADQQIGPLEQKSGGRS